MSQVGPPPVFQLSSLGQVSLPGSPGAGNRVGLPFERAGLGVEGLQIAAHAIFAAGDADDHVVPDHERRRVRGDAVLPLVDRRLPGDLAVGGVERHELGIEPGDE